MTENIIFPETMFIGGKNITKYETKFLIAKLEIPRQCSNVSLEIIGKCALTIDKWALLSNTLFVFM